MSVTETDMPVKPEPGRKPSLATVFRDSRAVWVRNMISYKRVPQLLVFSTIQPVIFVLMFRYVFGGAIRLPDEFADVPYVNYLIPGIFVQTVVFGSMGSSIGLANDLKSGLIERFRSLPMARSAVLVGRSFADMTRNVFVASLMALVGFLVGFRIQNGILPFIGGLALVLLFGYALGWVFATVGLAVADPETAQAASFPLMAPLVFASSVFVPVSTMPHWLQGFATHQPVSVTASAVRALILGQDASWFIVQSVGWCLLILAVFVPLSVHRYRKSV